MFDPIDWSGIFSIETPLLEIFVRGTLTYLGLFLMLRFVMKRQTGALSVTDFIVIVIIADAAQNGMSDDYRSVPDGLLLVATIMFWNFALDWASYHSPALARFIDPPEVPLIRKGRLIRANMRREMITNDELMATLRQNGVDSIAKVKTACIESDGKISVVTYTPRRPKRATGTPGAG